MFRTVLRFGAIAMTVTALLSGTAAADLAYKINVTQLDTTAYPDVRIVASVTDAGGRAVKGVVSSDLVVAEEGKAQDAKLDLASQTAPVVLVLVLDTSGSMAGRPIEDAKAAIVSMIRTLGPSDQAALVTFSVDVRVAQGLTPNKDAVVNATNAAVVGGDTAIYDAVVAANDVLAGADPTARRAIVLLTDGLDNSSRTLRGAALQRVQAAGYPAFVVGLGDQLDRVTLQAIADASKGGQAFVAPTSAQLAGVYAGLSEQILTQYSVAYRSSLAPQPQARTVPVRLQLIHDGNLLGETTVTYTIAAGLGTSATAPPQTVPVVRVPEVPAVPAIVIPQAPGLLDGRISVAWRVAILGALAAFALSLAILTLVAGRLRIVALRRRRETFLPPLTGDRVAAVRRQSFGRRVLIPLFAALGAPLVRMTPTSLIATSRQRLAEAGDPFGLGPVEFLGFRAALGLVGALVAGVLGALSTENLATLIGISILGTLFGYVLPGFIVGSMGRARKRALLRALPSTLDLLAVSVDAGLALDGAMAQVGQRWKNPLSDEFRRLLVEFQMGRDRRQALKEFGRRTGVTEIARFVTAVTQADAMGVALSKVLQEQAADMRVRRRQIAEEKARTAPIKMLFPMVLLIFPALFVVILGPAVPRLLTMFGSF
ncbi:MAG: VWA domain-containing protein [Chloroflexota bacterium]|nr:VWA domain-containing protein [Chloroflexota bacterium]